MRVLVDGNRIGTVLQRNPWGTSVLVKFDDTHEETWVALRNCELIALEEQATSGALQVKLDSGAIVLIGTTTVPPSAGEKEPQ